MSEAIEQVRVGNKVINRLTVVVGTVTSTVGRERLSCTAVVNYVCR